MPLERAVVAVVLEQMGVGVDVAQVVDGDQVELARVALEQRLGHLAADAAKPVDRNFHSHL